MLIAAALCTACIPATLTAHETAPAADVSAASKPVAKEQLLIPPASAERYVVVSDAGQHGQIWLWSKPDGSRAARYSQSLRGWITETDALYRSDDQGRLTGLKVRGITPGGNADESFSYTGGKAHWSNLTDGTGEAGTQGYYLPANAPGVVSAAMVEAMVKAGPSGIALLPSGRASLERTGITAELTGPGGPKIVELALIRGISSTPVTTWIEDGKWFADIGWISVVPAGYEAHAKVLRDKQDAYTAKAVKTVAHQFLTDAAKAPVLFTDVTIFDADNRRFVPNQSVYVADGKIAAIGSLAEMAMPAGVRTIDGKGKTLVPGLWDSHLHIGDDWDVLANLASGYTSFRSPGTMIDRAGDVVARRNSGDLLMGEPFISAIIDRKDPLAAQGALTVSSEAEAIAAVRKIKEAGLWGAKFYTSMNPAWIAPAAAEAHKLGLHVHGHVPATMRPLEAVRAGYDEITHLNFVMMQAMPKSVVDKANTAARIEGPAKYAKDVDLNSPEMRGFIAELAKRRTIIDPTLVIFEGALTMDGGTFSPAYAPYAGIISPVADRWFKAGGHPLIENLTRDDYRKSFAKMVSLLSALHKAGVPIVAGTDGWGIELVRELELYKQAGFSNADALATATIVPAKMVGVAGRTGSIKVGKEADLLLVDGDVTTDLGALRRVVTVVSDGTVMDGAALRKAAGWGGRPK
ncbi:amidohydrolase family protein [Sphingomonas sp. HDW15A]|nr:amidohydrolase family protein [Sphingomonas sp. HDW15A]